MSWIYRDRLRLQNIPYKTNCIFKVHKYTGIQDPPNDQPNINTLIYIEISVSHLGRHKQLEINTQLVAIEALVAKHGLVVREEEQVGGARGRCLGVVAT